MTTVIAESLSANSLDLETLLELSRRSDPVGVLSVYLDVRPGESAQAATIDLKNRLAELERELVKRAAGAGARRARRDRPSGRRDRSAHRPRAAWSRTRPVRRHR